MSKETSNASVRIIPFRPDLAPLFLSINTEWIESMFKLEAPDRNLLNNPQETIIDRGGQIWFAEHDELGIVGTCALMHQGEGVFELTKMGVLESARGLKVGETLLAFVLEQARAMEMKKLYLLSSKKCQAALHLYEKHGFSHEEAIIRDHSQSYTRCDVGMRWQP